MKEEDDVDRELLNDDAILDSQLESEDFKSLTKGLSIIKNDQRALARLINVQFHERQFAKDYFISRKLTIQKQITLS